ncbi:divalent-cation tolerance protein CutA [Sneathiella chinensis]|uniref:Divalent cation tolerance protein n=1 Tax=Sneathiella chinensis TaxID=349750 RepID=A0ABQ5U423_9PROT|nr:divalent-cation tolerance protein CutA [Sneathiella chinensis]GLQ06817.1 divalent cation tolerance protein [Sneathiella chinensis]
MKILDVWINCPDMETADEIANALLMERLAACVNIIGEIDSLFHWEGDIESETEIALLVKTREDLFDKVCTLVERLHPYDVPGITGMPVSHVNPAYKRWVIEETGTPGSSYKPH